MSSQCPVPLAAHTKHFAVPEISKTPQASWLSYLPWEAGGDKSEQREEISKPTQNNSEGSSRDAPATSQLWLNLISSLCLPQRSFPCGCKASKCSPLPSALFCVVWIFCVIWAFFTVFHAIDSIISALAHPSGAVGSQLVSLYGKHAWL